MSLLEGPFEQDKLQHVRHQLAQHPLMSRESLGALAMRHPPEFVRFHDGVRGMATKLGDVLGVDPKRERLRKCIESLDSAKAFVQIINVPTDPMYRPLVAEFHAEVAELFPRGQREFLNRDAAAFLASPRSVTPYHLDHEQNFLLHIAGPKTLYTWRHDVVPEPVLEVFYGENSSRDVHCPDDAKATARVFALQPGDGVYMPMGSPHAVETGDGVTITFSMLMNTRDSMERVHSYQANHKLRRLGLSPSPVGSAARDFVKRNALQMYRRSKELMRPRRKRASTSPWYQS
ncbi:MAG TPA: cupin domain-containing protein [Kofleriaceae bacterium]